MAGTTHLRVEPTLDHTEAPALVPQPEHFTFTGNGSEYFRIWIVNLLLTIVMLGIYSAWAKVRKLRYFYDNTRLAGASFDYHGNPAAILRGRIVAVLFIGAYNIAARISETAGLVMLAVLGALVPWLIWKSFQFKLYNSSYRGIRFGFRGSIGRVYFVYLLLPILSALTAYLLAPFAHQRMKKFQHDESRYGATPFSFHASVGGFYKAYLVAFAVALAGIFAIGLAFGGTVIAYVKLDGPLQNREATIITFALLLLAMYAWLLLLFPIFLTMLQNLIWNNTRLGEHAFASRMKAGRMIFIAITNLIGIFMTLGLFIPFAQVRMMKYRIESMSLIPAGSLDEFITATQETASATGEGVSDILDFDLSL